MALTAKSTLKERDVMHSSLIFEFVFYIEEVPAFYITEECCDLFAINCKSQMLSATMYGYTWSHSCH